MLRKLLIILVLSSLTWSDLSATHFMGGEITWECLPNGNFRFVLKVYRECAGVTFPNGITMNSNSPAGNIEMRLWPDASLGKRDISPKCNDDPNLPKIQCLAGSQPPNEGAIQEWTYTSDQMYPSGVQLNGIPPPTGWVFSYSSCCRNPCTNIAGSSSKSWFLRAIMYNYNNLSYYPCWDDSPVFTEPPETVICAGYPYNFNHRVFDKQGDSLVFDWGTPLEGNINSPLTGWNAGYSYTSPFPGSYHNANNIPAAINPITGDISLTSYNQGAFISTIKISAFKCGVRVADVFRELQMVIAICDSNAAPELHVTAASQVGPYLYIDTVNVGDFLNTTIQVFDTIPMTHPNGFPTNVHVQASGSQFGDGFTSDSTGCLFPPCATLTPPSPVSGGTLATMNLQWEVTFDHFIGDTLHCSLYQPVFDFWFDVRDDICPIPAHTSYTYRVVVDYPELGHSDWHCITIDSLGHVHLSWEKVQDPMGLFAFYTLSHSLSPNGPFMLLDTLWSFNQNSWIHQGSSVNAEPHWYKLVANYLYKGKVIPRKVFVEAAPYILAPDHVCSQDLYDVKLGGLYHPSDTLTWDFGQTTVISGSGPGPYSILADSVGVYTIKLEKRDSCGVSWVEKEIHVQPLPSITVSGNKFYCPGHPVMLEAHGGDRYLWSSGDTVAAVVLNNILWPSVFHVTVTDSFGCENTASVYLRGIQTYEDSEICLVTNDINTNHLQVVWEKVLHEDIKAYQVLVLDAGQWIVLESLPFDQSGVFVDTIMDPGQARYQFALQVIDSCDQVSVPSSPKAAMHLIAAPMGIDMALSWLPYIGLDGPYHYHIYRYDDVSGLFVLLDSVPETNISYLDVNPPFGHLYYYVAIHDMNCQPGPGLSFSSVYSNLVSLFNFTGIEEESARPDVNLFVDQENRQLYIEWLRNAKGQAELTLFDGMGRPVVEVSLHGKINDKERVPLQDLPWGLYFYVIRESNALLRGGKIILR